MKHQYYGSARLNYLKPFVWALLFSTLLLAVDSNAQNPTDSLRLMSYNLLNFPDPVPAGRADTLRKITDYASVDLLMVCELKTETGAQSILDKALNADGIVKYKRAAFVPNGSGGGDIQQSLFYNKDKFELKEQEEYRTEVRDLNRFVLWFKDPWLGAHHDTIFLDVYVVHLKAGNSPADELLREGMADSLVKAITKNGSGRNIVIGGDFNVYRSSEPAYSKLTDLFNPVIIKDPLNAPGDWSTNFSFQYLHTQSTRTSIIFGDGSGGGIDDRFDFILLSNNLLNGTSRARYLSGTYKALGNDGNCFNQSVLDCNDGQVPLQVRRSMFYMSDHLPVVLDLEVNYPDATGLASSVEPAMLELPFGNQCSGQLFFSLQLSFAQTVSVELYDVSGKPVYSSIKQLPASKSDWTINLPNTAGIFLLEITGESVHMVRKISNTP